ncbi:helix-turn-helix domain-containing protein [Paenibacillus sp. CN-4]|uniref:helix-turn-helix domain-containing protein n=1 Tax=Paenibacillus nanchangensis TaxID=3348343 RepID=UPI00397C459C
MNFADKLQSYRKQRGLSQENLADLIGVSRQAVSKWESGQSYPEMDKVVGLSELFHVSIDHLVKDGPEETVFGQPEPQVRTDHYGLWNPSYHYEYKSRRTLFGLPLVHIHIGRGLKVAKGILAVGNVSVGILSLGLVSAGILSLGVISGGLIGLGALAFGLLLAAGGLSVGTVAIGGIALGVFACGGLALGMFSLGGAAVASHVAIGGYANGHIAIGDTVKGAYTILAPEDNLGGVSSEQVRQLLRQEYPNLWGWIRDLLVFPFK